MPIEGSLREIALQDIFQLVHLSRKTGELVVVSEPSRKRGRVIFNGGAVVGCSLDDQAPSLGHLLLNAGKITEADFRRAQELHAHSPDTSWSDVFKSMAVVSQEEMEKFMKFQVEEVVYEILDWRDGSFIFGERAVGESECVTWIPTESLLMEEARRADELSTLPTRIEGAQAVPRLAETAAQGGVLDLSPGEWEVVGHVDGVSDVKSIAWKVGRSEFEISKVISRLTQEGLLEIGSYDASRTRPPQEMALDKVESLIRNDEIREAGERVDRLLNKHPDEPRAHFLHARILEKTRDYAGAVRSYEKTLELDPLAEEARRRLGFMKLRLGDMQGAAHEWTAYLRMTPDTPERRRVERAMTAIRELETVIDEFYGR